MSSQTSRAAGRAGLPSPLSTGTVSTSWTGATPPAAPCAGREDAARDRHGYVTATIPPTTRKSNVPVIGFIAHVDTSPEMSGAGVKPIVHRNYRGQDLVLPDDPTAVLRRSELPELAQQIGNDV